MLDAVSQMGFEVALIQNQNTNRSHYDTVWTMSIIRGTVLAIVILLLAAPASGFFNEPRLTEVLSWLAIGAFLIGFTNVGVVDFQKHLEFNKDFSFMVLVKVFAFVVTIAAAFALRDYWALIIGMITAQFARVMLSFAMSPYRPRFCLSESLSIFRFSKWLLCNSVLHYLQNRTDTMIVGKLIGQRGLGLYSIAYEIATLATTEMIAPIRRALLPGYAILRADPQRFRAGFIEGYALICIVGAPAALGIGLTADLFVPLFLGPKWSDAIPLVQILALGGFFQIFSANTGTIAIVAGKPQYVTFSLLVSVVLGVPGMIWAGLTWGAIGVAWTTVAMALVLAVMTTAFACKLSHTTVWELLFPLWRALAALAFMVIVVFGVVEVLPETRDSLRLAVNLSLAVGSGVLAYLVSLFGLWRLSGSPVGAEARLHGAGVKGARYLLGLWSARRSV
jgi:O-antigen/teichoic acid export membrane protein